MNAISCDGRVANLDGIADSAVEIIRGCPQYIDATGEFTIPARSAQA